jgi:hypothetical protein
MKHLEGLLSERNLDYYPGFGVPADDDWHPEPSHLVVNIPRQTALELGSEFGQNANVYAPPISPGGPARFFSCF